MRGSQPVRRWVQTVVRHGSRKVLWTQETANLGNFLYDWMQAFRQQELGHDVVCLRTPATEPWVPIFGPRAERLLVARDRVRLTDQREKGLYNEFGLSFDEEDVYAFAEGFLEPTGVLSADRVPSAQRLTDTDVLVNVRRGDYVTNEVNRRNYAFDLDEYLRVALRESRRTGGEISRIHVVSDDIGWCQQHLVWMAADGVRLTFEDQGLSPATHLALLSHAPRLVLANSTFSYWGGYLSEWRHRRPAQVVAPWFHIRNEADGTAWQLDPRWTVVRDIPSGWALPAADAPTDDVERRA